MSYRIKINLKPKIFLIFLKINFICRVLFLIILYVYMIIFKNDFQKISKNNIKQLKNIIKNTIFFIFNNIKQKTIFDYYIYIYIYIFWL